MPCAKFLYLFRSILSSIIQPSLLLFSIISVIIHLSLLIFLTLFFFTSVGIHFLSLNHFVFAFGEFSISSSHYFLWTFLNVFIWISFFLWHKLEKLSSSFNSRPRGIIHIYFSLKSFLGMFGLYFWASFFLVSSYFSSVNWFFFMKNDFLCVWDYISFFFLHVSPISASTFCVSSLSLMHEDNWIWENKLIVPLHWEKKQK